jgi:hypothetical protein
LRSESEDYESKKIIEEDKTGSAAAYEILDTT